MCIASLSWSPSAPLLPTRSEPAAANATWRFRRASRLRHELLGCQRTSLVPKGPSRTSRSNSQYKLNTDQACQLLQGSSWTSMQAGRTCQVNQVQAAVRLLVCGQVGAIHRDRQHYSMGMEA